ncbi:hypothetical protein BG015_000117 [Linnemannia schmuckeri]|uniref:Uncharacterized protein n=1 Tax=Linnemannia schmuckeri TaxID=64567 RepID=A0A9P5RRZ7_9FUNG|nr:hypothetical protein BG015_000117 [Linnemannia schmuckeri]
MDPLSKLPIECLQLILQVLVQERYNGALAALLQTNKYLATITLPFLYDNPYRKGMHGYMSVQTTRSRIRSDHVLTRMLLSQLPLATLPPVISNLLLGTTNATLPRPVDYAAYIRHLCLPSWALDLDFYWPKGCHEREALAYMKSTEFIQLCKDHNLLPCYEENLGTESEILQYHFQVILWRQACWSLASPILEQLQSLTIPVFDLDRYSDAIARLGNLEHLEFALDDIVDYSEEAYYGGDMVMSPKFESEAQTRKERRLRAMVHFVRDHAQLFPGRLKTVICSDAEMWPDLNQTCPVETKLEILRILPPLKSPTFLSKTNFLHVVAHLQSTDLSQVQEITDMESPPCLWYDVSRDGREFLQRCRALKSIHMDTLGPGSFAWATQEKRDMESIGSNNNTNTNTSIQGGVGGTSLQESRPAYLEHGLVPLEEFNILESDEPLSDEDDNVVFAFSQTLKKLTMTAATYEQLHIPRILQVGGGWVDLPLLTTLYISAAWNRLSLDIHLYRHCPNLMLASFTDNTTRYRCRDIRTCLAAELPQLDTLDLTGWSGLTFHPATLHSTLALKKLWIAIGRDDVDAYFIPPRTELDRSFEGDFAGVEGSSDDGAPIQMPQAGARMSRPKWTWDWYLPQLTSLTLTAEFAYRFQFRMLQGCPSLEFLNLNMRLTDRSDQFTRVLSRDDLFMPMVTDNTGREEESSSEQQQQQQEEEAIVAPSLEVVRLMGPWVIADELVPQFFIHMLPSLGDLEEEGVTGYTLERMCEVLRTMPNKIEEMHLSLPEPSEESAKEMGLIAEKDEEEEEEDDEGDGDRDEEEVEEEEELGVNLYLEWNRYFLKKEFSSGSFHERPNYSDPATVTGFLLTRMLLRHPRPSGGGGGDAGAVSLVLPKFLSMALTISDTFVEKSEEEAWDEYWKYKHALLWGPKSTELGSESSSGESWKSDTDDGDHDDDVEQPGAMEYEADDNEVRCQETDVKGLSGDAELNVIFTELDAEQGDRQDAEPAAPSSVDYMCHIRHLTMEKWSIDMEKIWPKEGKTHFSMSFQEYVEQDKDEQQRCSNLEDFLLRMHCHFLLYQEAVWALANPILEQLQSLYIPIMDTSRYLGVVGRLVRLESSLQLGRLDRVFPEHLHFVRRRFVSIDRESTTVAFVKEHVRLFPGRLRTATLFEQASWGGPPKDGRQETQFEIFQILPPLHGITQLTHSNLRQFQAHPLVTDVSRVVLIGTGSKNWVDDYGQLFQRCRSLRTLDEVMPGKGTFKWAVEEKQWMERVGSNTIDDNQGGLSEDSLRLATVHRGLVPLANVVLRETDETTIATDELDDIAFAFSQTLESVSAHFNEGTPLPRQIHIGQDGTQEYRCQDILPCAAARLDRIQILNLTGWSALTFNPATFHSTKRLGKVTMSTGGLSTSVYIPPVQELKQSYGILGDLTTTGPTAAPPVVIRPTWTWDWQLPKLVSLILGGEFAYRFQFRMLQGCPNLDKLHLDIKSDGVTHTRILSSTELYSTNRSASGPCTAPLSLSSSSAVRERIVAHRVTLLMLLGDWILTTHAEGCGLNWHLVHHEIRNHLERKNKCYSVDIIPEIYLLWDKESEGDKRIVVLHCFDKTAGEADVERIPLIQALFGRVPFNYLSDLLLLTYQLDLSKDIDATTSTVTVTTSSRNCFAHIYLNLEPSTVKVKCCWPRKGALFNVSKYLERETLKFLYESNWLDVSASLNLFRSETTCIRHLHGVIAYRHAIRALSDSILEQLQSLSIPVSDIEYYLANVESLQSLDQVRFIIVELYEKGNRSVSEAAQLREEEVMKKMI